MERWQRAFGGTRAGLAITAATVVSSALVGFTSGVARWVWLGVAVVAALVLFGANRVHELDRAAREAEIEDLAESVRVKEHGAIASAVVPLLRLVDQIHEESGLAERAALRAQTVTGVLNAAAALCGPVGEVRACWYVLDVDPSGVVRGLRYVAAAGRSDEPRVRFDAAAETGREVLASLLADERVFIADVHATRPPAWSPQEVPSGRYTAFLAVPVRGERQVHGMLTIDARHAGVLVAERDEPLILVLARVLAAALAERFEEDP